MIYRFLFDHLIVRSDPEKAHEFTMKAIGTFGRLPIIPDLARATVFRRSRVSTTSLLSRPIPGVVGLAAGLDKNATGILGLDAMGFGFVEIGTVTPKPQPGNDRPRLWRMPESRTVRNKMGFNNDGATAVAARLKELRTTKRGRGVVVGANIGKNKWTEAADAPADYGIVAKALAPYADFLIVNVSSPNTPGLRDLQAVESLAEIVRATRAGALEATDRHVPILVKIAPDLADSDIDDVAQMVLDEGLDGIVATNTTINHEFGEGGVSGPVLLERSLKVVGALRAKLGPDKIIIGVGGISSVEDGQRMLAAGADLLEIYTSFIYQGAFLPSKLNRVLR